MIKWILALVGLLLVGTIGYTVYSSRAQTTQNPATRGGTSAPLETTNPDALNPEATNTTSAGSSNTNSSSGSSSQTGGTPSGYTLAEVAKHNNSSSCWTAINGSVYDVTSWIKQHPGGQQAILSLCGKDGSSAFNGQHGGQARPASELAGFRIGSLAQ